MTTTKQRIVDLHADGRIVGRALQDIGDEVGVSRERVRQLLVKAGIEKPYAGNTPAIQARGQRQTEMAMQFWDAKAREHGFADFAALTQEWGLAQRLQVKQIAEQLGVSYYVGRVLKRCGYTPEPYRPTNFADWRGKKQSIEQIEKRRKAIMATNQRKRELGLAMRGRTLPREGGSYVRFPVYVDAATREKTWALAQRRGCSLSAVSRDALLDYLAKEA